MYLQSTDLEYHFWSKQGNNSKLSIKCYPFPISEPISKIYVYVTTLMISFGYVDYLVYVFNFISFIVYIIKIIRVNADYHTTHKIIKYMRHDLSSFPYNF